PALPIVVLVAVVVVLALGVAWLVLTGDDAGTPATDRDAPAGEQSSGDAAGATPTDVAVREVPEGVQVSWSGADEAEYVVTVLSPAAPPEPLPPTSSTSALVPNVEGAAAGGRCFTVAVAGDEGAPAAPASAPVCTAGASIEQMNQG
ncbi:MAG TPA: hypothetical protein VJM49_22720, partial [Acidimicrobiales bacterium]|nr:hypothetical protein [Acidimicrobiales bacterium]